MSQLGEGVALQTSSGWRPKCISSAQDSPCQRASQPQVPTAPQLRNPELTRPHCNVLGHLPHDLCFSRNPSLVYAQEKNPALLLGDSQCVFTLERLWQVVQRNKNLLYFLNLPFRKVSDHRNPLIRQQPLRSSERIHKS